MTELDVKLFAVGDEAGLVLRDHVLGVMFPRILDERGGFHENWGSEWEKLDGDARHLVFQARAIWVASAGARVVPERAKDLKLVAEHGLNWLRDKQWDEELGGFWWEVDLDGNPSQRAREEKHMYGMAFAVFALAEMVKAFQSEEAMNLAVRAFTWMDHHAHDRVNQGYFESLTADGKPFLMDHQPEVKGKASFVDVARGYRTLNTHLHLLEAFSSLVEVWPESVLEQRISEILYLMKSKMFSEPGCFHGAFTSDWRAVPGLDSYGHDVEAAFLMIEAAGMSDDPDPLDTAEKARMVVDHALDCAYDGQNGGLFADGDPFGRILDSRKVWWVQAELLNSLVVMHSLFGVQTDHYAQALVNTWEYVFTKVLDQERGGWKGYLSETGEDLKFLKMDEWTEGYHQTRALVNLGRYLLD